MQLRGLVKVFTILLILICIYTMSFTWIVSSHEKAMAEKASSWVKRNLPTADEATKKSATEVRLKRILDSTLDNKIGPMSLVTYRSAKEKQLNLGLDLQGGISVTIEVGMDELIRSLADKTKDQAFNNALNAAVAQKANTNADLVSLFVAQYRIANPTGNLATFFINKSAGAIKINSSEGQVSSYLKKKSEEAFKTTTKIITTRIDRFGVNSPGINPDPQKGIIHVELAGAKDPEYVKSQLVGTANLQFFEAYRINDIGDAIVGADKAVQNYLMASVNTDTAKNKPVDSTVYKANEFPIYRLIQFSQPSQDPKGNVSIPPNIGYVAITDTAKLNGFLRMDIAATKFSTSFPNLVFMYGKQEKDKDDKPNKFLSFYAIKTLEGGTAELEGDRIKNAVQDYDGLKPVIRMEMDREGANIWGTMTTRNVGKPIAVVLDNVVYSAPNINEPITGGTSQISGGFDVKEAQDLAQILEIGKLPTPAKVVQSQEVGATLGTEAINGGALSFFISFGVIFILMLVYYNTAGWVANIALILNIFFTIAVLTALQATLTAASIAGLVLTIGMAVDTNVIIFERIKEELLRGKSHEKAVEDGYKRSLAPVLDAHVTSFLTAFILFTFGLGPVLGFATTQMLGITLSLLCGILISRLITDMYAGGKNKRHFEYFTGLSKRIFKHAKYKFIEYRKYAYMLSVVVLIAGVAAVFNGFDEGVEFAGGRSYDVQFAKTTKAEDVRTDLKVAFGGEAPIVKTVGTANTLNITTAYKIKETGNKVDSAVLQALYAGLKKHLPENTDFTTFITKNKLSEQTVLPSISKELKSGAIKAGIIAIIVICFYIFIRFRDWRYSVGTIVALLHDVFVTLAVFSFCRSIVPFPLEIDQHFIAAVLTVIGFSMNDTVIVYDRIREDSKLYPNLSKEAVINTAINETLSRTIMTSLTVFLTILILFIFGGEVTKGFAFAMLIGVITGTYSSIFVAAPILVDFAKNKPLGKSVSEELKVEAKA